MADYYLLIRDAIAAVDAKTGVDRRLFYDRARALLADHLRKADPPLSETLIEQEQLALEDAIRRIEALLRAQTVPALPWLFACAPNGDGSDRPLRSVSPEGLEPIATHRDYRPVGLGR
jgi:hypothetical protein